MKLFKRLLKRKKLLIIITIIVVLVLIGYNFFVKNGEPKYITEAAAIGTVIKEVSETGAVKVSEQVNLGFKYAGRIDQIDIKVGDQVEVGQSLAKLDISQLYIELAEARAAFDVAQADYDKLLAGSSPEEIKVAETEVLDAEITLDKEKQDLEDVKANAQEDLNQAYEDGLDALNDAYLKMYNAFNKVSDIQRTYFTGGDQEGATVRSNKDIIEDALDDADYYIDQAKDGFHDDIDTAISKVRNSLTEVRDALEIIRNMTETSLYRDTVTSADKTALDTQKTNVNTAYTNVLDAGQDIATTKITNQTNINAAEAAVAGAEVDLQKEKDDLALKKAGPTPESINYYSAKVDQAQASVSLLNNKISETNLKSPIQGQITRINKREGETVQSTDSVISLLPTGPFQVEVDIYEEDIVDLRVDNFVTIELPAFPDQSFEGRVISVDPAEKLIDGVVYYEVNIIFDTFSQDIKPGMTADVIIEADKKENVLTVPRGALEKINGANVIMILERGKAKERRIEVGLEGDEYVEVISGVSQGEQVIIGEKRD
jgi:RND family efflux transporter MFP subunit